MGDLDIAETLDPRRGQSGRGTASRNMSLVVNSWWTALEGQASNTVSPSSRTMHRCTSRVSIPNRSSIRW